MTNASGGASRTAPAPFISFPLAAGLIALVVGLSQPSVLADADSYWHIAAGRWILAHLAVPTQDVFSHSVPGIAWSAHEWGAEVAMSAIFAWGGWLAMQFMAASAFALTIACIARFLADRMEPQHAIVLTLVSATLMLTHLLARPHVIVWPLTAVWVGTLVRATETRTPPPWWLLGMMLAWANLHASFTLAIGFGIMLAAEAVMQCDTTASRVASARRWGAFLVAAVACSLVNPQGPGAFEHARRVMGMNATLALVSEWKSADFHSLQPLLIWLVLVLGLAMTGRLRLSAARLLFVIGLIYLALKHQRYHALVGVVSPMLLATPIASGMRSGRWSSGKDVDVLDRWLQQVSRPARWSGILAAVALVALIAFQRTRVAPPTPQAAITPERALAAFAATGVEGRVLNEYSFGGYLIFRGVPVFYDGRGDMYGDALMREAANALYLRERGALERVLAKYRIGWTLLNPKTPAALLLDYHPAWQRVYSDSIAVVHVRRDLMPQAPSSVSRRRASVAR